MIKEVYPKLQPVSRVRLIKVKATKADNACQRPVTGTNCVSNRDKSRRLLRYVAPCSTHRFGAPVPFRLVR